MVTLATPPIPLVTVSGQLFQDQQVQAQLQLPLGETASNIGYQWRIDGKPVAGATGTSLSLRPEFVGRQIDVQVSYTDKAGAPAQALSILSKPVGGIFYVNPLKFFAQGAGGNDLLLGSMHDDVFFGSPGDDQVQGGDGLDMHLYGTRANYQVTQENGKVHVIDLQGKDGQDTLESVERVMFEDGAVVAFDVDGAAGQVFRLYRAAFDRAPDAQGLGYWIGNADEGLSLLSIANGFVKSQEWGSLYADKTATKDTVAALYQHVLHRAPDAGGLVFWSTLIESGQATVAEVLVGISESQENHEATAALVGQGISYQYWAS